MPKISGGKYVVVGGASLLGSHIGEQLLAGGAREVILLDNLSLGSTDNIDALLKDARCTFLRGDILRINELYDSFAGANGVFAVAGFLGMPITNNPWLGIDVNVRGMQNLLEASRYQKVKKVVFSSSVGVYGAVGDEPNTDNSPLRWSGMQPGMVLYCTSKIMGEALGRLYQQRYGVDFLALRYSAIYGEHQHKRAIDATRMVEAYHRIRSGKAPRLEGDGSGVQDYVYVGDVARANLMGMESDASDTGLNIASGVDTSQSRIAELIAEACRSDLKPEYYDDPTKVKLPPSTKQGFNIERARILIGWKPEVTIQEGIRRLVAWFDQQRAGGQHV
jgi:UDP-glucose 4-epimerase